RAGEHDRLVPDAREYACRLGHRIRAVSDHHASGRELCDLGAHDLTILRSEIETVLAQGFDDAEWVGDAADFQQPMHDGFADLVLAQGVEVNFVDRAAGGYDKYRRTGLCGVGSHGFSGLRWRGKREDEGSPGRIQEPRETGYNTLGSK